MIVRLHPDPLTNRRQAMIAYEDLKYAATAYSHCLRQDFILRPVVWIIEGHYDVTIEFV